MKAKTQIAISLLIATFGIGLTGYFKIQQNEIEVKTAQAKSVLADNKRQLKDVSTTKKAAKMVNDPAAKSNEINSKKVDLLKNNGNAFFKLLYNVNKDQTQDELDTRNKNLPRYATDEAIEETGLNTKSIDDIKKYAQVTEYLGVTLSVAAPDNSGIYNGIADVNSSQTSSNFKGKHNDHDWYLFEYNSKTQKFTKFTLLGFNFSHDNG